MTTTVPLIDAAHLRGLPEEERDGALAAVSAALEGGTAQATAAWAVPRFRQSLIAAPSRQDTILPHLFAQQLPGVEVLFLETGYPFPETLETRATVARSLPVTVVDAMPRQTVAEQDAEYGPKLHDRDPNLCCFLRKVEPLARSLEGRGAWVTGVRRV